MHSKINIETSENSESTFGSESLSLRGNLQNVKFPTQLDPLGI